MEQTIKKDKTFYLGIELLRIWGAMAVVWIHYGPARMPGVAFAVPCFVVMSFFFSWKTLDDVDGFRLFKRIKRLAIPFVSWGCVSYLISITIGNSRGMEPLLWQLCLGHATCTPLYYIFDITVIFVLLFLLRKCFVRRFFWPIVVGLAVVCFSLQYS